MQFADLVFDKFGCCGDHHSAHVAHPNGTRTEVTDNDDGTYTAATFRGSCLCAGVALLTGANEVEARLASDALLRP